MKKLLLVLVAVAFLSPSFAEDKTDEHATDKKVESTDKKGSERVEKEGDAKSELSKKVDACLKDRPEKASK